MRLFCFFLIIPAIGFAGGGLQERFTPEDIKRIEERQSLPADEQIHLRLKEESDLDRLIYGDDCERVPLDHNPYRLYFIEAEERAHINLIQSSPRLSKENQEKWCAQFKEAYEKTKETNKSDWKALSQVTHVLPRKVKDAKGDAIVCPAKILQKKDYVEDRKNFKKEFVAENKLKHEICASSSTSTTLRKFIEDIF